MKSRLLPALSAPALAAFLAVACGGPPADTAKPTAAKTGEDWPTYGGTPSRNMVNTVARGVPTEWGKKAGEKNVKWVAELGDKAYCPPAVAGGRVYVATNDAKPGDPKSGGKAVLKCFNEADGKLLWENVHEMPATAKPAGGEKEGLLTTPAVEGDRVYYITPGAEVVCADAKDKGKILWRLDLMKQYKVFPNTVSFCSPLLVGDLVYVISGNGKKALDLDNPVPEPKAPSFVAVNKKTGELAWSSNLPGEKIMEGQWASPAYAEVKGKGQVIFPGGDGWLYAFEPAKGELLWKFDYNAKGEAFKPGKQDSANYLAAPAVVGDKLYTGTGQQPFDNPGAGRFWCIDLANKGGDVSAELEKGKANPNSAAVWKYDGPAPKNADRDYLFARSIGTPAVHDGLCYTADIDGFVYCFDAAGGKLLWQEDLKQVVLSSPLWVDGKVYVADDGGTVHIFAHGKEAKRLGKVEMGTSIKTSPVVANGVLYVTTEKRIYAIAGK